MGGTQYFTGHCLYMESAVGREERHERLPVEALLGFPVSCSDRRSVQRRRPAESQPTCVDGSSLFGWQASPSHRASTVEVNWRAIFG
jgi:hypothetical protein